MIFVTVERTVRRRPEIVWDALTDLAALTSWVEGLVEAAVVGDPAEGVGTRLRIVHHDGREATSAEVEITAWVERATIALETRGPGLLLLHRVSLAPAPLGTSLGVYAEVLEGSAFTELFARPHGLLGASERRPAIDDVHARSVDAFVKRVEAQSAVPYR